MSSHGFFQHLKLKAIAVLIHLLNYVGTRPYFKPSITCNRKAVRIPSRDFKRFINAWIYYAPKYDEGEPRGLVVNWHGGGYIMPNLGMDHVFCERIARENNILVLDADYRKATEHPFPRAVEDAEDTLRWVESQPHIFDLDHIALSGFSSGAHLALVASSELRREFKKINIKAVYPFYTGVDFSIPPEEKVVPEPIAPLPVFFQHLIVNCYLPRPEDRRSPRAVPMYAEPSSFPERVLAFVCSGDILAPEVEAFGKKLEDAGRGVEVVRIEGVCHGFDKPHHRLFRAKEREITYAKVVEDLKEIM